VQKIRPPDFDVILCDMVMPGFGRYFYRASSGRAASVQNDHLMTGHTGDTRIDEFIRGIKGLMLWETFQIHESWKRDQEWLRKTSCPANRCPVAPRQRVLSST